MIRYNIYNKGNKQLIEDIKKKYNVSELVARIMINRNVPYESMGEYLNPDINKLHDPYLLRDVKSAAELTNQAIMDAKKIRIIGDYDIDGIMSTYILIDALKNLGADVDYQIPHRIEDGYGLNSNIIKRAIDDKVNLIITCDNGVSAIDEIAYARDNGIDVIITDHHELMHDEDSEIRPNANYLINPKREGDEYPFKKLCGAVVAWKFVMVLYDVCSNDSDLVMKYLEYAAFATIGDVMELTGENRIIVKFGLEKLSKTDNIGLKCLINNKLKDASNVTAYDIGFILGPCINASGRLDTAALSLQLLLSEDINEAKRITTKLIELNEERKAMTENGVDNAVKVVEETMSDDKVLVVYVPDIHESVAGIVAGRLRELFFKPVIVLCDGEECVKGSGRSVESYNMYEALLMCKDLFIKFGGHPMAAGMSLDMGNVDALRKCLNDNCKLSEEDLIDVRMIDTTVNLNYLSIPVIEELEYLEPFGNGNKKPLFAKKNAKYRSMKRIGNNRFLKFEFELESGGGTISGLYFQDADELEERINKADNNSLTIMFYPQVNTFNGIKSAQIVLSDVVV